jgi:hypothetical protein
MVVHAWPVLVPGRSSPKLSISIQALLAMNMEERGTVAKWRSWGRGLRGLGGRREDEEFLRVEGTAVGSGGRGGW